MELATRADVPELRLFGIAQFVATCGHLYEARDLENFLAEGYSEQQLLFWIDRPQYRTWVWRDAAGIIGYILCGPCTLPLDDIAEPPADLSQCGDIKRLFVAPGHFGAGVGPMLLKAALSWLAESYPHIYLGVYSENLRAQRFYAKWGFRQVGEYGYRVGDHVDREFILKWNGEGLGQCGTAPAAASL